jgi:hypothetical protein
MALAEAAARQQPRQHSGSAVAARWQQLGGGGSAVAEAAVGDG